MKKEQGYNKTTHMNAGKKRLDAAFLDKGMFDNAESLWLHFMTLHKSTKGFDVHSGAAGNISVGNQPYSNQTDIEAQNKAENMHIEILGSLNKAYKGRRLLMDHLRVLHFYGQKGMAPRGWISQEARGATLWKEALSILTPIWQEAGYITSDMAQLWQAAQAYMEQESAPHEVGMLNDEIKFKCGDAVRQDRTALNTNTASANPVSSSLGRKPSLKPYQMNAAHMNKGAEGGALWR